MVRQFLIALTDKLTDLFIISGCQKLSETFFDWHWSLTWPDEETTVRDWIKRALREDGER